MLVMMGSEAVIGPSRPIGAANASSSKLYFSQRSSGSVPSLTSSSTTALSTLGISSRLSQSSGSKRHLPSPPLITKFDDDSAARTVRLLLAQHKEASSPNREAGLHIKKGSTTNFSSSKEVGQSPAISPGPGARVKGECKTRPHSERQPSVQVHPSHKNSSPLAKVGGQRDMPLEFLAKDRRPHTGRILITDDNDQDDNDFDVDCNDSISSSGNLGQGLEIANPIRGLNGIGKITNRSRPSISVEVERSCDSESSDYDSDEDLEELLRNLRDSQERMEKIKDILMDQRTHIEKSLRGLITSISKQTPNGSTSANSADGSPSKECLNCSPTFGLGQTNDDLSSSNDGNGQNIKTHGLPQNLNGLTSSYAHHRINDNPPHVWPSVSELENGAFVVLTHKGVKLCPMCELAFPNYITQDDFEQHVIEHFSFDEPNTAQYSTGEYYYSSSSK